jgi:glycine hydroxymethyltransferase
MSVMELATRCSLDDAAAFARDAAPAELCEAVAALAADHEASFHRSLDLVGSHGLMSPRARGMLDTGLIDQMRQTGRPGSRVHTGGFWIDRIETIATELAKRLFGVNYAELRPLSCAQANELVFAALAKRGDVVMVQTRLHGADPSVTPATFGGLFGYEYADLPYDEAAFTADAERAAAAIRKIRPRLVVIGSGNILFPYPVLELKAAAASVGAILFYDGAHSVGLTAGGGYQDPAKEGADVITGSVPKTICGPTGGLILANDAEIAAAVQKITDSLVSSYPNNHLAALAVTFAELLAYGNDYVRDMLRNARALAEALDREGFIVLAKNRGFTRTHLVLFEDARHSPLEMVRLLEAGGIFSTPIRLPKGSPLTGVRLGTSSVTRRGMGPDEMQQIAAYARRILLEGEGPAAVARDVAEFASAFRRVHYCFP